MTSSRTTRFAVLVLLFLLPLALRLLPIEHGGERIYVPDNSMVRAALGMARDRDLIPPVSAAQPYPNLMPYLLLPLYGAQYVVGRASGAWSGVREFGDHLLQHPAHAAWIARALVALFGALTVWVVFRAARAAGMKQGAWVAAWLTATGLLSIQMSTQERPWVPQVFFMAAAAWAAIVYVNNPRTRTLVLSGAMAGLSLAAHQGGLGALLIPGFAWALAPGGWKGRALWERLGRGTSTVLVFALVALVAGHLYLVRYGWIPSQQVVGGAAVDEHNGLTLGGMVFIPELSWDSVTRLSRAVVGYDPIVLFLGLAGFVLALRVRSLLAPMLFVVVWALTLMTNRSDHVRYLLPVTTFLALPAGLLAERMWAARAMRPVLILLLAFPLVQAARFDWIMMRDDTRAMAERMLADLPPDACIAIDRYGPEVDLDKKGIYVLQKIRNSRQLPLRTREEARKAELDRGTAARRGVHAVHLEEVFGYNDRERKVEVFQGLEPLGKTPSSVFQSLSVTHYLRVDRRLSNDDFDFMFGANLPGHAAWTLSPSREPNPPREAFLPLEMEFPLTALWIVDRPGPWLELRKLR